MQHASEITAENLWESIADRLRGALTETTYETWFGRVGPVSLHGDTLVVEAPNDFTRDWIQSHFFDFVSGAARESLGRDVVVSFSVGSSHSAPSDVRASTSARPSPLTSPAPTSQL